MKRNNLKRLSTYLRESEGWITAEELAMQLHTTTRTVRNYVRQLNNTGGQVIESSARGYRWITKSEKTAPSLYHPTPQTPMERELYALRKFLWQERIAVEDLMAAMIVSDRTLDADLNSLRRILRPFHISLHRHKEILYLTGKEIDRRRLIAHCVWQSNRLEHLTLQFIIDGFAYLDVQGIHTLLLDTLALHGLMLDGYRHYDLLLHVVIQAEQLQRGNTIRQEEFVIEELELSPDYLAAHELAEALETWLGIAFPYKEVAYLTALILSNATFHGSRDEYFPSSYPLMHEAAQQCLRLAGSRLKLDFFQAGFPVRIAHYLLRMKVRQQMCLSASHPLTNSLRNIHPLLLDIAAEMMLLFASNYKMPCPMHEVGGLALMLADYMYSRYDFESKLSASLFCPEFGNLAGQLKDDLMSHLGNTLTIERIITTTDVNQLSDQQLILSVLPLRGFPHAVVISPMPKSEDYRMIREEIQKIKAKRRRQQLSAYFTGYLRPETFLPDAAFSGMEELLHNICGQLVTDGAADPGLEQEVLAREQMDQTAFFDMLAVPHAMSDKVRKNRLYIILNHTPLPWGNTRVNLIALIAMQPDLRDDLYALYGLLILTFAKPKNIRAILHAKDYHDFLKIIPTLDMESD